MWESVLGCGESSLKRGVGEMRRDGGCEKMWGRCGKVCWGVGGRCGKMEVVRKCGGGVGKCVGVW